MKKYLLLYILILAGSLRLFRLGSLPPSPYWEEAALGYDAYSIAKTGKDHHGNPYPLVAFPSFGDYKPSGYFYAIIPFIQVIGLNIWSVRLPSAIAGIMSVALLYLIGKEVESKRFGFIAAFLFAIEPWTIQFSRGGWEVNLAFLFILLGAYCLIRARKKAWFLPLAVLPFGCSMYTYHAARLFSPLVGIMGIIVLLIYWKRQGTSWIRILKTKSVAIVSAGIIALLFTVPFAIHLGDASVSSRFSQTSIFTDIDPILKSNAAIIAHGNTIVARILYHRYWYFSRMILSNILSYFSPVFLFLRGDGNYRHSPKPFGILYPLDAFFIIMGIWYAVKKKDIRIFFPIIWVILATIPASLVLPNPHALRFLFSSAGWVFLCAYGIDQISKSRQFTLVAQRRIGIAILYAIFLLFFVIHYFTVYPRVAAADWQYGYKQLYEMLQEEKKPGEQVYVSREQGRPSMYYLFYTKYDPALLQKEEPTLPKDQLELLQVDDYHFVDIIPKVPGLFATSMQKMDNTAHLVKTIPGMDGKPVWAIWRR